MTEKQITIASAFSGGVAVISVMMLSTFMTLHFWGAFFMSGMVFSMVFVLIRVVCANLKKQSR